MAEMSEAISLEKVPNEHEGHPLLDDLKGDHIPLAGLQL